MLSLRSGPHSLQMSTYGKASTGPSAKPTRNVSSFAGRADVAGMVASSMGKGTPSVLVRLYHKLHKKHQRVDLQALKASISAPLELAAPTPSPEAPSQPMASPQAGMLPTGLKRRSGIPAASHHERTYQAYQPAPPSQTPVTPTPTSTQAQTPAQVGTTYIPSQVSANTNTVARRLSPPTIPSVKVYYPYQPKKEALPSSIPGPASASSSPRPNWRGAAHPNPLCSHPPVAVVAAPEPVQPTSASPESVQPTKAKPESVQHVKLSSEARRAGIGRIMGKKYRRQLSRMKILPPLMESAEENAPPTPKAVKLPFSQPTTALPTPPSPKPATPVKLTDTQQSQSQQAQAHSDLVATANTLKAENTQLSSDLQDAISQRIVADAQLEQQKKATLALEESLKALWALVQPNTGLPSAATPAQIREQILLLSTATANNTIPKAAQPTPAPANTAAMEQRLAKQTQQIAFYRRSDAAAQQVAGVLADENKAMKARLDKVEAERSSLRTSLDVAEDKLRRIERSLYVYPASATEEMETDGDSLEE